MSLIRSIISFILIIFIYLFALIIQFVLFIYNRIAKLVNHKSTKNEKNTI
jgi:hypothetical protein